MRLFFFFLGLIIIMPLSAQEGGILDWDLDTIFYMPPPEAPEVSEEEPVEFSPMAMLRPPGFTIDGAFEFAMGLSPGWNVTPWFEEEDRVFNWAPVARMQVRFDLDTQISEILRVRSSIYFTVPGYTIELREFFFDYTIADRFFFRGGRFNQNWGVSPNFAFTNLPARVPDGEPTYDPFIMRLNIPVGIGGFQFLSLTRRDLFEGDAIGRRDIAYGGRFNMALRRADIHMGVFYQEIMPLRGFLSIQTTIGSTELYNEWLGVIDVNQPRNVGGAVNLGFVRDFFRSRVTVNGELFLNTERNAFWYRPETNISEAETLPFNDGLNIALNVLYRFRGPGSPRLFVQAIYAPAENSAQLIPGFRLTPWEHVELYFAVPMALGCRDGHFYRNTADPQGNRPFAIVMLLTLRGSVRIGQS